MSRVYVSGAFDEAGSRQLRFLQEAARLGPVTLLLWPDEAISSSRGAAPKMGLAERVCYFEALRFVDKVDTGGPRSEVAGPGEAPPARRARGRSGQSPATAASSFARYPRPLSRASLTRRRPVDAPREPGKKRVIVTGCYDWLHTGHLRFFEEASAYGELNVVIGSDANVRLLKGEGHPLFSEAERSYVVGSFRGVARCLVSSGSGWLDAEPEIRALGIERYVVNEDGDKPEKRRYCEEEGIEYIVLKRVPKEGLPRRSSTDLRGY